MTGKDWIIEGVDRNSNKVGFMAQPLLPISKDVESVPFIRELLLMNGVYDATITTPNGSWFGLYRGFLFDLDKDPADFFPMPTWPFNEFRKEKL